MTNNLTLNSKLTLKQFIELFNDPNENELWNLIYLQVFDTQKNEIDFNEVKIIERNYCEIK